MSRLGMGSLDWVVQLEDCWHLQTIILDVVVQLEGWQLVLPRHHVLLGSEHRHYTLYGVVKKSESTSDFLKIWMSH